MCRVGWGVLVPPHSSRTHPQRQPETGQAGGGANPLIGYVIGISMPDAEILSLFNLLTYLPHRHTNTHTQTFMSFID